MAIATDTATNITPALRQVLRGYDLADAVIHLLNVSENHTYQVESGDRSAILRLYRASRTPAQIRSELAWLAALANETAVSVPRVLADRDGQTLHRLATSSGRAQYCVLFERLAGHEPTDNLPHWFAILGGLCARLHRHGQGFRRPPDFDRPRLDWPGLVGERAIWGSWRQAPGLSDDDAVIAEAAGRGRRQVEQFGYSADRFGLIHGDLRPANLLVDGACLHVIDFDDCADGWLLYDLATALSLLEDLPNAADLIAAWLNGYTQVTAVPPDHIKMIPHLVMLRRIQILSWLASHGDTDLARTHGPPYVTATVMAARRYTAGGLPYGDGEVR